MSWLGRRSGSPIFVAGGLHVYTHASLWEAILLFLLIAMLHPALVDYSHQQKHLQAALPA